jgi:hypothetical protein
MKESSREVAMNPHSNQSQHSVRRIVLPSGRTIEVVRFQDGESVSAPGLHICPKCQSDLVQPVEWSECSGGSRWELTLECPNCWWVESGVFGHDEVTSLEEKLDDGVGAIVRDLQRLTHANMADQIDRFVAALRADVILPEDF